VAKRSHEVVVLDDAGEVRGKSFGIANSRAGMRKLIERVDRANPERHMVVFGLEATSHYWLGLYAHLRDEGREVVAMNPMRTSAYPKLQIREVKNDRRGPGVSLRCCGLSRSCGRLWRMMWCWGCAI
jgi:transposase